MARARLRGESSSRVPHVNPSHKHVAGTGRAGFRGQNPICKATYGGAEAPPFHAIIYEMTSFQVHIFAGHGLAIARASAR
jgi:hypothetical protein